MRNDLNRNNKMDHPRYNVTIESLRKLEESR